MTSIKGTHIELWDAARHAEDAIDVDDEKEREKAVRTARRRQPKRLDPSPIEQSRGKKTKTKSNSTGASEVLEVWDPEPSEGKLRRSKRNAAGTTTIKMEDFINGKIKCPDASCGKDIFVPTYKPHPGCSIITCTKHFPYLYFCYHCKTKCYQGTSHCGCRKGVNKEVCLEMQKKRIEGAARNPIVL
jgi:hypothetical protein